MPAEVKILVEGYTNADSKVESGGEEKTCATITLVRDEGIIMVVDPGVLESQQILVDALAREKLTIHDVNIVCITHSHLDHYRNIGMFPKAKALDFFGVWDKNICEEWQEQFSKNIQILRTPGHDYTSITLFVNTGKRIIAICGDVFWRENSPEHDHNAKTEEEQSNLDKSREKVLEMADWVIPGHGKIYKTEKGHIKSIEEEARVIGRREIKTNGKCRKCGRQISKNDRCLCRSWLCARCCECGLDCDLCGCSHKR
jgi:glyoxylase-like metal-dependent hydrolase (beta-lactamase superfamily II)